MRKRIAAVAGAAFIAVGAAAPAAAARSSICVDVTVMLRPPGVNVGFPYPCQCGPALTSSPIPGGVVYTINTSCFGSAVEV